MPTTRSSRLSFWKMRCKNRFVVAFQKPKAVSSTRHTTTATIRQPPGRGHLRARRTQSDEAQAPPPRAAPRPRYPAPRTCAANKWVVHPFNQGGVCASPQSATYVERRATALRCGVQEGDGPNSLQSGHCLPPALAMRAPVHHAHHYAQRILMGRLGQHQAWRPWTTQYASTAISHPPPARAVTFRPSDTGVLHSRQVRCAGLDTPKHDTGSADRRPQGGRICLSGRLAWMNCRSISQSHQLALYGSRYPLLELLIHTLTPWPKTRIKLD